MFQIVEDGAELTGVRITSDGYLAANVRCARTGIQEYAGSEFGLMDSVVRVYRPESEVFSKNSLKTFSGRPVTNDHPSVLVDSTNWKDYAVGSIGEEVLRDGDFIRVPMTIMDADVIKQVQEGKREISMGYLMDLAMESGVTDKGEEYDAIQTNLKMNHLAIVQRGRAGSSVRVGDNWGATPNTNDGKANMTLKTFMVDGLSVETTEAGYQALTKLTGDVQALKDASGVTANDHKEALDAAQASSDAVVATKDAELAAKDTELAAKDAEIVELKSKVLDGAALDARVAERASFIDRATKIIGDEKVDFSGKSDLEIKAMAADAYHGVDTCKDKSPAYIEASFDLAKVTTGDGNSFREALINREVTPAKDSELSESQAAYQKRINDGWKG